MHVLPLDPLDRVTGSSYLVHIPERDVRLLVDCGAYQDGPDAEALDDRPFPFDPARLTAVLLTHAHYDHCGRLPRLVRQGFRGHVVATEETIAIAKVVLEDSARLRDDAKDRAAIAQIRWRPIGPHLFCKALPVATDVFVFAYRSAHIVGAVSMEIVAGPKERPQAQARALFSGDIGNNLDGREVQPFLRHVMHPSRTVDLAVMESTYGGIRRAPEAFDADARRARLADAIRTGLARGGPVIVPAFGVQRAQDVLWDLHLLAADDPDLLGGAPILLDAPMALRIHPILLDAMRRDSVSSNGKARPTWLGRHVFAELGLDCESPGDLVLARAALERVFGDRPAWRPHFAVPAVEAGEKHARVVPRWWRVEGRDRDALVAAERPAVVVATGGMADGGPVRTWLAAWLGDPRATVAFTGYCGTGTLGGELVRLATMAPEERARLHTVLELPDTSLRACDVRADIRVLGGWSAHADQARLVEWAFPKDREGRSFPVARRVLITHGDGSPRRMLRDALLDRAAAEGVDLPVLLPRPDGPGIDARTGEPVPREAILGVGATRPAEEIALAEALAELRALRAENRSLRAENQVLRAK